MPHEIILKRKLEKELTEVEGYVYAFSGKNIYARDVELKSVHSVELTPKLLHNIAAGSISTPGAMDNYFTVRITNTATSGPSVEATGSFNLYFRAVGE